MPADKLSQYVAKVRDYLASDKGRKAWDHNRRSYGYTDEWNYIAAIQTVTRIVKYERLSLIYYTLTGHYSRFGEEYCEEVVA